jgi:hypothetical protein
VCADAPRLRLSAHVIGFRIGEGAILADSGSLRILKGFAAAQQGRFFDQKMIARKNKM